MKNNICANCSNHFSAEFCNKCGQKIPHKITMSHIGHELVHTFTHADKGFFYLLIQLFIKPGIVGREYILEGKRKKYFMPFQYIFIIGSIGTFVAVNSHFFSNTLSVIDRLNGPTSASQLKFITDFGGLISKYYNLIILIQLPFFAYASYLVFKKYKLNYAEHLTFQTFISAQSTIISMVTMLIILILKQSSIYLIPVVSAISFSYQIYATKQFFKINNFKGTIKATAAGLLGVIFFMIVMFVFVFFYIKFVFVK